MKIEKTEVRFICDQSLQTNMAKAIRGFFGNLFKNRPEFHGHIGNKLIYKHPLIQYKILGGYAHIIGLQEGAYLLKALPKIIDIEVFYKSYSVVKQNINNEIVPFGLTDDTVCYNFISPWIGLNKENFNIFLKLKKESKEKVNSFFDRILIGNILSMCKSLRYTAEKQILLKSKLAEIQNIKIKNNVQLATFEGEFETNFLIPDLWGIGGKVSIGYGIVQRKYNVRQCNNSNKRGGEIE